MENLKYDNEKQNPSINISQGNTLTSGYSTFSTTENNNQTFIKLNVCGQRFQIKRETLLAYPTTRLGRIALGKKSSTSKVKESLFDAKIQDELYFERDPSIFPTILSFYITGVLHVPRHICIDSFQKEIEFWGIPFILPACCEGYHQQEWEVIDTVRKTNEIFEEREKPKLTDSSGSEINLRPESCWMKNKRKIWDLFENPRSSKAASIVAMISSMMVIISTVVLCVNTLPEVQVTLPNGEKQDNPDLYIVEIICIFWFTVEYGARAASSPNKLQFLKSVMNGIDLLSIIPFYVGIIIENSTDGNVDSNFTDVRRFVQILRIFRIIRIFKVARHSAGLQVLGYTVRNSSSELGLLFMLLIMGMTLFSCLVYYAEQSNPKTKFNSIIASFWWAIITMTTVGYGDMYPETILGKIIGSMCCVSGIIFIALPIPTIVSNFSAFYKDHINKEKLHKLYSITNGNTVFDETGGSSSSILLTGPDKSIFNCNTIPNTRVSLAQIERHDQYKRRMSTQVGSFGLSDLQRGNIVFPSTLPKIEDLEV